MLFSFVRKLCSVSLATIWLSFCAPKSFVVFDSNISIESKQNYVKIVWLPPLDCRLHRVCLWDTKERMQSNDTVRWLSFNFSFSQHCHAPITSNNLTTILNDTYVCNRFSQFRWQTTNETTDDGDEIARGTLHHFTFKQKIASSQAKRAEKRKKKQMSNSNSFMICAEIVFNFVCFILLGCGFRCSCAWE